MKTIKCINQIIKVLNLKFKADKELFLEYLKLGRINKTFLGTIEIDNYKLTPTLILGDEGGLYWLLNSFEQNSFEEQIIKKCGVQLEYIQKRRKKSKDVKKIIIGEGGFGRVRLCLGIFKLADVDVGQVLCVKKSRKDKKDKRWKDKKRNER